MIDKEKLMPVEYRCIIELDEKETTTKGGIFVPEEVLERQQMAETTAVLVAVGPDCFQDWGEPHPKKGDRILITKYAGEATESGNMASRLRVCNDKDIAAIIKE
jgi:co-chaperonin GroES (HSP10)